MCPYFYFLLQVSGSFQAWEYSQSRVIFPALHVLICDVTELAEGGLPRKSLGDRPTCIPWASGPCPFGGNYHWVLYILLLPSFSDNYFQETFYVCDNEIKTTFFAQVEMEMTSPGFGKIFRKQDTVH